MKNLKTQLKLNDENNDSIPDKSRKFSDLSSPQTNKGKTNYSTIPLVDSLGSLGSADKNYSSHNDKAYSLSSIKKNENNTKNKSNNDNNQVKNNLQVTNQSSNFFM